MLNIVVCVKAVPEPKSADKLKIDPVTRSVPRLELPLVMNPLDRHALEAALQLKNKHGANITVLSMGPPPAATILRECLALGADQGILLCDPAFAGSDAFATANTLANAIKRLGSIDLIMTGMASSDGSTEWVGPELAAILGIPVVTRVKEIVEDLEPAWIVKADHEGGYRIVKVRLPAVLTVTREINQPKSLSFSGILKARTIPVIEWSHFTLGLAETSVGLKGSPTHVASLGGLELGRQVKMLDGSLKEKVTQLVQILTEEGVL